MNVLMNENYKSYDYLSRYSSFPYYYNIKDDKYTYGITAQLRTDTTYVEHIVKQGETIDALALKYYNNPTKFWIICDFNRIQDPFIDLKPGQKLKMPIVTNLQYDI